MTRPMAKQMELFEDGGLKDEGGTVDPVSGNDVPPGSTKEEVRDDIPAQLSEGEFVFPADVVRFIGLEKLMKIRQRAKAGLQRMEDMGQMGNSEEAIMPDDLPFSIDDLDMEDDGLEMAQGGLVSMAPGGLVPLGTSVGPVPQAQIGIGGNVTPMPGGSPGGPIGSFNPQIPGTAGMNPLGTAAAPMQAASAQQNVFDPNLGGTAFKSTTSDPNQQQATFTGTVGFGPEGLKYDTVVYVNEAGDRKVFLKEKATGRLFNEDGTPATVPEGYKLETAETAEKVTTDPTKVKTTQVQDEGGDGNEMEPSGGTLAFGGEINPDTGLVENSIRGNIEYRGANFATGPLGIGGIRDIPDLSGRLRSAAMYQLTNGKSGKPMSLKPGESVVVRNLVQSRPGVNRSTSLGTVGIELDDKFYNEHVSGKNVTGRKTLEKVANYISEKYGTGKERLGKDSILSASQTLSQMNLEKARAERAAKVRAAQSLPSGSRARTEAFGVQDPSSPTGYTQGSVISDAIAEAQADMAAADARGDSEGFNDDGSMEGGAAAGQGTTSDTDVGYGSGTDCLTEDMKVKLNGVVDFVTNVKVGDIIDSYRVKEVLHKHMRNGYYAINNELKISNDHPVLANGTWTRPEDLSVGDSINGIPVASLEYVEQLTPTVSIVIDGESFDVHTENNIYTVHGRYREVRQEAA